MTELHTLFRAVDHAPTPAFEERLLLALHAAESHSRKHRVLLARAGVFASSLLCFGALFLSEQLLAQSEFLSLFSLLFSDLNIVWGSLGDFTYSLLETLPIFPLALLLGAVGTLSYAVSQWLSLLERPISLHSHHVSLTQ